MKPVKRTPEERKAILEKIKVLVKQGKSTEEASKLAGITSATYYNWRGGAKKPATRKKTQAELMTINYDTDRPLVILMGDPAKVTNALDRLAAIFAR